MARITETDAVRANSGERLGGDNDERVDPQQDEGRVDTGLTGNRFGILRLLVQVQGGVPAPVDEEHVRQTDDEVTPVFDRKGIEPRSRDGEVSDRGRAVADADEGPHR